MKKLPLCCATGMAFASLGLAANFSVTTTNHSGPGSLRQAITDANAGAGADVITFNIPPPGFTIVPTNALPPITDPLTIDGATQPGYSSAPLIELNGQSAGSGSDGLKLLTSNCVIRALLINRFTGDGIEIATNGNNVVEGCLIGLDAAGVDRGNSLNGVNINRSPNNRIGGTNTASRNVISGNGGHGVNIVELTSFGNVVLGNYIGTDSTGTLDRGNSGDGVEIDDAPNNIVGGTTPGARNVISGNGGENIEIFTAGATNNLVLGNYIGTDVTGTQPVLNGSHGVYITTSARWNVIGGTNAGAANLIAFNNGDGVFIATGTNNAVLANRIFANVGLGIDLGANGVTANDATDADTGANQLQNFPILTNAFGNASNVTIQGLLTSRPSTTYQLDFFANQLFDPTGNGEAQFFLGSTNVTTDAGGNVTINVTFAVGLAGRYIVATATDSAGNTSELSPCVRASSSIAPATFTVVNTNDSGAGSLRQAVFDSNARVSSGTNRIEFNIPGGGVHTIAPVPALPVISEAVVIDGYSQPGTTSNTVADKFNANLLIRLDGVSAGTGADGLALAASNSTVRGFVIVRFNGDGIHITSAGNTVSGNIIGLDVNGADLGNGANGVFIESSGANMIGGTTPASRNVISGNGAAGVWIENLAAAGNIVQGNLIGTDATGTLDRGNTGDGVDINDAPNNVIGGATPGARNLISGNSDGIQIFTAGATNNVVQGNWIGTDVTGTLALPNSGHGVNFVTTPRFNLVGGTNTGAGNLIAFNGADGVFVSAGTNNAVRANQIHSNTGLGIDVGANNITPNDVGDADSGANQLQNFPVLTNAVGSASSTLVQGMLNSRPSTVYSIDFFSSIACDPSSNGEAQFYLGSASVTTDGSGNAAINSVVPMMMSGNYITATATDPFGNTSEFSPCLVASSLIPPATFTVTTTNDSGAGSLRQAIVDSNARVSSSNNTIAFNIPGGGIQTIAPATALPAINTAVTMDGLTQPGASANTLSNGNNASLHIRLNGVSAGAASSGLRITGSNSVVRGLIIVRFGDYGIELSGARHTRIEGNFIGIDADSSDAGNALDGIYVNSSAENVLGGPTPGARNVISGNNGSGILVASAPSSNNVVQGNFIGTDLAGVLDRGNSGDGVEIDNAPNNIVGGSIGGARNLISGNNSQGVAILNVNATNNVVQGNVIGADISGGLALGNSSYGVHLTTSARGNLIGGTNAGAGNTIQFNGDDGVFVQSGTNNAIRANSMTMNGTTSAELGIDLGVSGVTTNDPGDADTGANQLQNWPVVTNAIAGPASTLVQGEFNSRPSETYQLDFFANVEADSSGRGEGALFLGSGAVTTDASGNAPFSFNLPRRVVGRWITATATDSFGNTSEFSLAHRAASTIPPQTFTVVNTNDSGGGSLRQAMLDNNGAPSSGWNTIAFNLPGSGVRTIMPATALPPVTEPVLIDGFSQPGASANTLAVGDNATRLIRLSGELFPQFSPPPLLRMESGSIVRGLIVVRGGSVGVQVDGDDNVITGNAIGLDADGVIRGNYRGALVDGDRNRLGGALPAERNIISGNVLGLDIYGVSNSVLGSYIGTDVTGTAPRGNTIAGVSVFFGGGTVIGGTNAGAGNLISGNDVGINTDRAVRLTICGNYIGTDASGQFRLANEIGILLYESVSNRIGGTVSGAGNLISGNNDEGIVLEFRSHANVIQGNIIGADRTGAGDLGNVRGIVIDSGSSNLIGGTVPMAANIIGFNKFFAIVLGFGTNNSFLGNSIFSHESRAILLDEDDGANQGQSYPQLLYATSGGPQTTVRCSLTSQPNRVYRVEFFRNNTCGYEGRGEGEFFLGATNLTTDSNGQVLATVVLPGTLGPTQTVTATATDPDGNTSEFSACAPNAPAGAVDLRVAVTDAPDPVRLGQNWTNSIVVTNASPTGASGVVLTHRLPLGATFVSAAASQGSFNQAGGVVTFNVGSLGVDTSALLEAVMTLASSGQYRSTSTVAAAQSDYLPANNVATTTGRAGISDIAIGMTSGPHPVTAGQTVTISVWVTNLGPDTASSVGVGITPAVQDDFDFSPNDIRNFVAGAASSGTLSVGTDSFNRRIASWSLPSLAPGATANAQVTFIPAGLAVTTPYTNRVESGHVGSDPNPMNNVALAQMTVLAGPGILDLSAQQTVRENATNASIIVTRKSGSIGNVTVQYATTPGSATPGSDYSDNPGTLTLTNGQTLGFIPVPLVNDSTPECNEFFRVFLLNPGGGAVIAERTNVLVEVFDDDQPPPAPSELPVFVGPGDSFVLVPNGQVVVFSARFSDVFPDDFDDTENIFARDLVAGTTNLVSRNLAGPGGGNGRSFSPAVSADGRFVSFSSEATGLTTNTPNVSPIVYRHDRWTGATVLVSENLLGNPSAAFDASLSANGQFVAFSGAEDDFIAGDTNGTTDVFLRDIATREYVLMSANPSGHTGNSFSRAVVLPSAISPDASLVLFNSAATDLAPGAAGAPGTLHSLFARDVINGKAELLVTNRLIDLDFGELEFAEFSGNGKLLVFTSTLNTLVTNDTGFQSDVFVRDMVTGAIRLVSRNTTGAEPGNDGSFAPAISANGRYVTFSSRASDLAPNDNNNESDVFRHDLWTGATELVSVTCQGGSSGDLRSLSPAISADGRFIAFSSFARNIAAVDLTAASVGRVNVYVRDMLLGQTRLVSFHHTGTAASRGSSGYEVFPPQISHDGGTIAFASDAVDLVSNIDDAPSIYVVRLNNASPAADLALTMTSVPNPPVPGSNVTFTLVVTNHGPITATNVVLTHTFPTNAPFISAVLSQGTFTRTNGTIFAQLGSITSGQHATVTVVLVVPANPNSLFSVANVTAYQPDSNPGNNYGAVSTIAGNLPILPPLLTIIRVGAQLEVSWPDSSTGFVLQQRASLNPPSPWQPAPHAVTQSGGRFRVLVTPSGAAQFFRLARESGGGTPPPSLKVALAGNVLSVRWPSAATTFGLQSTTNLAPVVQWAPISSGIVDDGTWKTYALTNSPDRSRFFRLIQQ